MEAAAPPFAEGEIRLREHRSKEIDRTDWDAGPWDDEPDHVEWRHNGVPCMAVRNRMGCWCGYAGVDPKHPYYGLGYSDVESILDAHGGITYANGCSAGICHVPTDGETDQIWWFGFDTAHYNDFMPASTAYPKRIPGWPKSNAMTDGTYRDMQYIYEETNQLADQLIEKRSTKWRRNLTGWGDDFGIRELVNTAKRHKHPLPASAQIHSPRKAARIRKRLNRLVRKIRHEELASAKFMPSGARAGWRRMFHAGPFYKSYLQALALHSKDKHGWYVRDWIKAKTEAAKRR